MDFPSGVHPTWVPESDTLRSGPPNSDTTKIPLRARTKAISRQSGDQAGLDSDSGVSNRRRTASVPTAFTQISVGPPPPVSVRPPSPGPRPPGGAHMNATTVPSGDSDGAPSSYSSETRGTSLMGGRE